MVLLLFVSEVAKLNVKNEYLLFRFQITFAELQWRRKMKQMRDNEYQVDYDGKDNNNDDVNDSEKDDWSTECYWKWKHLPTKVIETFNLYSKRDVFCTLIVLVYSAQFGCVCIFSAYTTKNTMRSFGLYVCLLALVN